MPAKRKKTASGLRWLYEKEVGRLAITDENGNPKTKRLVLRSKAIHLTKKEALAAEAKHLEHYNETGLLSPPGKTLTSSAVESVEMLLARRLAFLELNRSQKHYSDNVGMFKRFLELSPGVGSMAVMEIDESCAKDLIVEYHSGQVENGHKGSAANALLVALRTAWNEPWDKKRGDRLRFNPWAQIDNFNIDQSAKYVPNKDDVNAVISAALNEEFGLFVNVMRTSGARPGEALSLTWSDIRGDNKITLYTRKKRGGIRAPRVVPITAALTTLLKKWRLKNMNSEFVFCRRNENIPRGKTWVRKNQIAACEAADIKYFTPHTYRHYYASQLAANGVPIPEIQYLLGHENIQTTSIYLHSLGALADEQIAAFV